MKLRSLVGSIGKQWAHLRRRALIVASAGALAGGLILGGINADVIDFEDFEGLTLVPFDVATATGDGTDWTNNIPGWTIDNSGMSSESSEGAYNGVTAMDVDSWISEQGTQLGRGSSGQLGVGTRNTVLVFDGDAWADFSGGEDNGFNSYISRTYDLTGRDLATLSISLDYEFASEVTQRGVVEVSFDGGTNWTSLLDIDSATLGNDVILSGPGVFNAGTDFTATSTSMTVRIGKIAADNNWWFAVDNVKIEDGDGVIELEDFEGLTMEAFTVAAQEPQPDGTDYTQNIPNWVIDNSQMALPSAEGAFNGWAALDVESWMGEQGLQGRSSFEFFGEDNTVLVADPDAWQDYADGYDSEVHSQGFNSYITRTYDISGYARGSISIELWYEFRVEDTQRGLIDVSFDGGNTWTNLLDLDSDGDAEVEGDELTDGAILLGEPVKYVGATDFNASSNQMMLRIGCVDGGNDWWFAIDDVKIEGDPLSRPLGDANDDGEFDTGDIAAFVSALVDSESYEANFPGVDVQTDLDFNGDKEFDTADIAGFVAELIGG